MAHIKRHKKSKPDDQALSGIPLQAVPFPYECYRIKIRKVIYYTCYLIHIYLFSSSCPWPC